MFLHRLILISVLVIVILVTIIVILSRKSVRAKLYSDPLYAGLFPDQEDGEVFLVHVDDDLDQFVLLKDTLEGNNKKGNKKQLGGRTYKTLYHERDFIPGDMITENIVRCVTKSRRTLILLTPSFLKSDWSRDEFCIAQRDDKALFIKIKLNDSQEKELDRLLSLPENAPIKLHLNTRTYLKWTGEEKDREFWKWLAYLLPHKKAAASDGVFNILMKRVCFCRRNRSTSMDSTSAGQPKINLEEMNLLAPNQTSDLNDLSETGEGSNHVVGKTGIDKLNIEATDTEHENKDWFHPSYDSIKDAAVALINTPQANNETYLVTNIPESEKSYKLYRDGNFVLLVRGKNSSNISQFIIQRQNTTSTAGYVISGSTRIFSSLYELVNYYSQMTSPDLQAKLSEPLRSCKRCRRCSSRSEDTKS